MLVILHKTILSLKLKELIHSIYAVNSVSALPGDIFNANFVAGTSLCCAAL